MMRFVQFKQFGGRQKLGVQLGLNGDIVDLNTSDDSVPSNLLDFIKSEDTYTKIAKRIVAEERSVIPLKDVVLLPPIIQPGKVLCVGLNYQDHCKEANLPLPTAPCIFNKFPSTIVGPYDDVIYPENTKALDWEVELAVIIGKTAKNVSKNNALNYVFGYTVAQDITARDWHEGNINNGQWLLAKSFDTCCPIGPAVVTKESLLDPHSLAISCSVSGLSKQNSNTCNLIFKVDDIIEYVSMFFTLFPGDIILTGTPAGVGGFKTDNSLLKRGDVIESEIDGIGKMMNKVI